MSRDANEAILRRCDAAQERAERAERALAERIPQDRINECSARSCGVQDAVSPMAASPAAAMAASPAAAMAASPAAAMAASPAAAMAASPAAAMAASPAAAKSSPAGGIVSPPAATDMAGRGTRVPHHGTPPSASAATIISPLSASIASPLSAAAEADMAALRAEREQLMAALRERRGACEAMHDALTTAIASPDRGLASPTAEELAAMLAEPSHPIALSSHSAAVQSHSAASYAQPAAFNPHSASTEATPPLSQRAIHSQPDATPREVGWRGDDIFTDTPPRWCGVSGGATSPPHVVAGAAFGASPAAAVGSPALAVIRNAGGGVDDDDGFIPPGEFGNGCGGGGMDGGGMDGGGMDGGGMDGGGLDGRGAFPPESLGGALSFSPWSSPSNLPTLTDLLPTRSIGAVTDFESIDAADTFCDARSICASSLDSSAFVACPVAVSHPGSFSRGISHDGSLYGSAFGGFSYSACGSARGASLVSARLPRSSSSMSNGSASGRRSRGSAAGSSTCSVENFGYVERPPLPKSPERKLMISSHDPRAHWP